MKKGHSRSKRYPLLITLGGLLAIFALYQLLTQKPSINAVGTSGSSCQEACEIRGEQSRWGLIGNASAYWCKASCPKARSVKRNRGR